MKLTTNTQSLVDALSRLKSVIPSRSTIPILGSVRIIANGALRLAANNLDQSLEITLEADVAKSGEFTLPCNALHAALSCMDAPAVSLTKEKDCVAIECGSHRAKMQGLPSEEFPEVAKRAGDPVVIPGAILKHWLLCCIPFASSDPSRYTLNGVHLTTNKAGNVRLESTDGHRLIVIESDIQSKLLPSILPIAAVKSLAGLVSDGDASISEIENAIFASGDGWEFSTKKVDGRFPGVDQFLSLKQNKKVAADREALMRATRYAALFVNDYQPIQLAAEPGNLTVSAKSDIRNGATQLDGFPKNDSITIGVKPAYLLDILRCFDTEEVTLELAEPSSPIAVKHGGITAITLPIRIA